MFLEGLRRMFYEKKKIPIEIPNIWEEVLTFENVCGWIWTMLSIFWPALLLLIVVVFVKRRFKK